ncbi:unnamed protein product [Didymodactylos carnosus]|uniref:Uncharacterized protein n=1 Tax=Didymodactylos carnosus TaxID=1234261 RepID=A0A814CPX0_9BILA|nr:unnamed protein product [Didymodactylos carnosus]CAF1105492.1 unnamed protein product [Didymodactylos carnosus]CAF3719641.1 unnamed protein product [Didymodactylos carnosus]CAF3868658.1 unnamed protein product [Didymodactylos carnosus]
MKYKKSQNSSIRIFTHVLYTGKDIINLLQYLLNEHKHIIKMDSTWTPSKHTIEFMAEETFWHDLFYHGLPKYVVNKNHMNVFKEIEIKCNTEEIFELIKSTFVIEKSFIEQKEVLEYFKNFCEKYSMKYHMTMICTCLKWEKVILEYQQPENQIMLLKLTCNIE